MAVMMPREKWTDERLGGLNKKVDDGFARLDGDIRSLRSEMKTEIRGLRSELKGEVRELNVRFDKLNDSINARFDAMNASINTRFDAMNRNLIGIGVTIVAALIGVNAF
jgi:chromosome segregation ATPase